MIGISFRKRPDLYLRLGLQSGSPPCPGRGSHSRKLTPLAALFNLIISCTELWKAIDLMTRRLVAAGQRPVTVGMYFSLGHST